MSKKEVHRLHARLDQEQYAYLAQLAEASGETLTAALEKVLREHQEQAAQCARQLEEAKLVGEAIGASIQQTMDSDLTRIRLASNKSERTTQEIMEVLNSLLVHLQLDHAPAVGTMERPTMIVEGSKEIVRERIARFKQITDERKAKQAKKEQK